MEGDRAGETDGYGFMSRDDIVRCKLRQAVLLLGAAAGSGLAAGPSAGQVPVPAVRSLDLDAGWRFRQVGTEVWRRATVPGTVQTDLLADSLIPDPFYRDDEAKLQWIGLRDWEYARSFEVPTRMLRQEHLLLVFHGLDTYADVRLNGRPVLRADNMFRTWTVDVTGRLRAGENRLDVRFRSPIPIEDSSAAAFPYKLPAGNDPHATRIFTRKAGYHYGWDWGPRFVTEGIWRPVRLVAWSRLRLDDAYIEQRELTDARARFRAHVTVAADTTLTGTLTVASPEGAFRAVTQEVRLVPGMRDVALDFTIPNPRRWWPNGLGPHPLYTIAIALEAGGVRDTLSRRIGLRTLELVQRPDAYGTSFTFRVNGVPVFMKGANYIPQDNFTPRVDSARYAALFRDAVDSHMNMLRVWGGGIYERDLFYRMADENGILLWQEFMFANGMYPVTPAFLANVRVEAEQQVRRLRNHPSLALWCGNNEIHEGWDNWGWQKDMGYSPADSAAVWAGYVALFQQLLPSVVDSLDPGVSYWETSPSMGWGHPGAMSQGDSHYWGVWGGEQPFDTFRQKLPRFMSEFGFQAYPSMRTIAQFTLPGDRALGTPVMKAHQKNIQGDSTIERYMRRWFAAPKDFASFVYLSQVLQAEGMKVAFEAERSAMPRTMGSLYWQLDDS
jgi:beta-mannosidase